MLNLLKKYITFGVFLGVNILLTYFIDRSNFPLLIFCYALLFGLYFYILREKSSFGFKPLICLGILVRICLLFNTPSFSDDYFRFIWDGRISAIDKENPYLSLPEKCEEQSKVSHCHEDLYEGLNSKQYYTVYPPINQFTFSLAVMLGNQNIQFELFWLKFLVLLAELAIIYLLPKLLSRLKKEPTRALIYILNPLVIIEVMGNLHFEGTMFFFLILAFWLYLNQKKFFSALMYAFAIGTKLIPLLFLPYLIRKYRFKNAFLYSLLVGLLVLLMFLPFLNQELISNFWSSIDLYFQSFEFNASIFYLIREIGFWIKGYDIVQTLGPILVATSAILIILLALQGKWLKNEWFEKLVLCLTIYLLFATTVHPWYVITLLGISVFSKYHFPRYWSLLVFLSYSHYWGGGYAENYVLIFLEYLILFCLIGLELFNPKLFKKLKLE